MYDYIEVIPTYLRFLHPPQPLPPPPTSAQNKWILCQDSLTRELKIRVVGFV